MAIHEVQAGTIVNISPGRNSSESLSRKITVASITFPPLKVVLKIPLLGVGWMEKERTVELSLDKMRSLNTCEVAFDPRNPQIKAVIRLVGINKENWTAILSIEGGYMFKKF